MSFESPTKDVVLVEHVLHILPADRTEEVRLARRYICRRTREGGELRELFLDMLGLLEGVDA